MDRYFKAGKYKELVLYVVQRVGDQPGFGSVLLNKILVDCDFTAFRELGAPICGQKVQHESLGPISAPLVPVGREMVRDGLLEQRWGVFYGNSQRCYVALREADMERFSEEEIKLIDSRITFWSSMNGTEASEASHRLFGGWAFTTEHEEIRYETAYLMLEPLSNEAKEFALGLIDNA